MSRTFADDLLSGMELRVSSQDLSMPIDFAVMNSRSTLVFRADWWTKEQDLGVGIIPIEAVPAWNDDLHGWSFALDEGYLISGPGDEDQEKALQDMRFRIGTAPVVYRSALDRHREIWGSGDDPYDFTAWLRWATDVRLHPIEGETAERLQGRIRLRNHRGDVIDALVIDEHGFAATADVHGFLVGFAADWIAKSPGERPSIHEFLRSVAGHSVYGDRTFDTPEEVLGSGDLEEIALQLVVA